MTVKIVIGSQGCKVTAVLSNNAFGDLAGRIASPVSVDTATLTQTSMNPLQSSKDDWVLHGADMRSFLACIPTTTAAAMLLMMLTVISITIFLGSIHVALMGAGTTKHGDPFIMLPTSIPFVSFKKVPFSKAGSFRWEVIGRLVSNFKKVITSCHESHGIFHPSHAYPRPFK